MVKYILRLKVTCYGLRNAKLGDLRLAELRLRVHGGAGQVQVVDHPLAGPITDEYSDMDQSQASIEICGPITVHLNLIFENTRLRLFHRTRPEVRLGSWEVSRIWTNQR